MSIQVESTTDSKEQVLAAIGGAKSEKVSEQKQSASSEEADTSEQDETHEASDTSEEILEKNDDELDSDDDEESKDESKEDQKPKKRSGFQRRIDKFQKNLTMAKADADKARTEAEHWKQVALSGAGKPQEKAQPETSQQKVETNAAPEPETFDSHREYVEALTDWKMDQRERAKEIKAKETQYKTEYQTKVSEFQKSVADFQKTTPDFQDVVSDVDDIPLNQSIQEAILTSDFGPELMYELSKNRSELERINALAPHAMARAIGRIEERINNGSEKQKPSEQKITKTPPPIDPVGSKSISKTFKSPEDMSYQEYKKFRAANK